MVHPTLVVVPLLSVVYLFTFPLSCAAMGVGTADHDRAPSKTTDLRPSRAASQQTGISEASSENTKGTSTQPDLSASEVAKKVPRFKIKVKQSGNPVVDMTSQPISCQGPGGLPDEANDSAPQHMSSQGPDGLPDEANDSEGEDMKSALRNAATTLAQKVADITIYVRRKPAVPTETEETSEDEKCACLWCHACRAYTQSNASAVYKGTLLGFLSKTVEITGSGPYVLHWRRILLEDFTDTICNMCNTYRIRGGSDMNWIRRDHQALLGLLQETKAVDPQIWTASAERALQFGLHVQRMLGSPNTAKFPGTAQPFPSARQMDKTKPRKRTAEAQKQLQIFLQRIMVPAFGASLQSYHGSEQKKREAFNAVAAAAEQMAQMKTFFQDVWFLYAEFLLIWLYVRRAKTAPGMEIAESR